MATIIIAGVIYDIYIYRTCNYGEVDCSMCLTHRHEGASRHGNILFHSVELLLQRVVLWI